MRDGAQFTAHTGGAGPHPLAVRLAAALRPGARVLVVGVGSGRSLPVLNAARLRIFTASADDERFEDVPGSFEGILSTHALIHGTPQSVRARVDRLYARLVPEGRFHATFGSTKDPRFEKGTALPGGAWAPTEGSEAGVAHTYFDRSSLERMLGVFGARLIEERDVQHMVGVWAHAPGAADAPSVHWFVEARR